jgi:hypothetical protein
VNEKLGTVLPTAEFPRWNRLGGGRMKAVDVWESADAYQKSFRTG